MNSRERDYSAARAVYQKYHEEATYVPVIKVFQGLQLNLLVYSNKIRNLGG